MSSEERPSRTQKLDVDDKVIIDLREGWWLGRVISIEEAPPPWPERMISVIIDQDYTHDRKGEGTVQKVSGASPAIHKLPSPNPENFG